MGSTPCAAAIFLYNGGAETGRLRLAVAGGGFEGAWVPEGGGEGEGEGEGEG